MTKTLGPGGKEIGTFPEQMPYQEWLHSDYTNRSSCQSCHMPLIPGQVPITAVLGQPREGAHRHTFVAGNFFMLRMLNLYRKELSVAALPTELTAAAERTVAFLQGETARVSIPKIEMDSGELAGAGAGEKFDWSQDAYGLPIAACVAAFGSSRRSGQQDLRIGRFEGGWFDRGQ